MLEQEKLNPKAVKMAVDGEKITLLQLNGSRALMPSDVTYVVANIRRSVAYGEFGQEIRLPSDALCRAVSGDFLEDDLVKALTGPKLSNTHGIKASKLDLVMGERVFTAAVVDTRALAEISVSTLYIIYDHPETP